ncbi:hypothetical protein CQ12_39595 [Bradyrhizobium jicamae]|uniref:Uncharacterized protein n=1 Tax=Bradyrhizobium jicamae TaxID=280332 RepID=A0A0R3L661_9BRAD|nr:hypothetical protein [Bradyrhizobium jicamae]KRR03415.1 hypothetical protein CQ12_39595 [Bradyrhizobium jicamae]
MVPFGGFLADRTKRRGYPRDRLHRLRPPAKGHIWQFGVTAMPYFRAEWFDIELARTKMLSGQVEFLDRLLVIAVESAGK